MIFWSELVAATVLIALAVWQWRQVQRHPHDAALATLAVGVTIIAFTLTMSVTDVPQTAAVHAVLRAVSFTNIAWTVLFYCYSVFFLLATMQAAERDPRRIRRRATAEFGLMLAFLFPALLALYTADPDFFGRDRDPDSYLTVRNVVYYVGTSLYPFLAWVLGTVRAVAFLRLLRHRGARVAVVGVVTAMGVMAWGVSGVSLVRQVLYIVYPGSKWPLMSDLYNVGRISGQILLVLSLVSVPLMALLVRFGEGRDRRRRRSYARALEPLWRAVVEEFPHVLLQRSAASDGPVWPDLDRMMVEVSDGLSYLAEWSPGSEGAGIAEQVGDALAVKRRVDRARWAGKQDVPEIGDLPRWEPDFPLHDRDARARWMVQLAEDLDARGLIGRSVTVGANDVGHA